MSNEIRASDSRRAAEAGTAAPQRKSMNPTVVMGIIVLATTLLTYLVKSGEFARDEKKIIPDSYQEVEKVFNLRDIFFGTGAPEGKAAPVSLVQMIHAVPQGIIEQADLIIMVMFIGGMFGVLQASGTIDAGLEKLLKVAKGNVYILVPVLMVVFSFGSTFLGMAKEYLLVIPIVIAMTNRLKLPKVIGLAIVAIPVKVGYAASITNPFALSVAQPLVGVPVFSGLWLRVLTYCIMLTVAIVFVLFTIRRYRSEHTEIVAEFTGGHMSSRQGWILVSLIIGVAFMVFGSQHWEWETDALAAYYLALGIVFGVIAGFGPSRIATEFVAGMKKVMIAAVLIGMATAVALIMKQGMILDTIIGFFVGIVGGHGPYISAYAMMVSQLFMDVAIPSTSGQAAVTMPILGPVGEIVGVTPQTTVFAFLMGNGLTNVITPTSSGLLIFLATAEVSWTKWAKYVWPLMVLMIIIALAMLTLAVAVGY
ncbi:MULTISPECIES: YfcC family protein [Corynebacterium]|uniref:YfcC family protein n=1 Tax=Corynebacterium TaxID=1716 RepID=UPI0008A22785|nr:MULTISPECIES: YfcC family protein [Corynebacterium]OFT63639.1 C4-dicarboxylate ABC transporter [Corynebacterium sp. HMSC05E07]